MQKISNKKKSLKRKRKNNALHKVEDMALTPIGQTPKISAKGDISYLKAMSIFVKIGRALD